MSVVTPTQTKSLGRQVKNFNLDLMESRSLIKDRMKAGILHKFRALYRIAIYQLFRYFGYTIHIGSFLLVT